MAKSAETRGAPFRWWVVAGIWVFLVGWSCSVLYGCWWLYLKVMHYVVTFLVKPVCLL